jgi:hypothetical protein
VADHLVCRVGVPPLGFGEVARGVRQHGQRALADVDQLGQPVGASQLQALLDEPTYLVGLAGSRGGTRLDDLSVAAVHRQVGGLAQARQLSAQPGPLPPAQLGVQLTGQGGKGERVQTGITDLFGECDGFLRGLPRVRTSVARLFGGVAGPRHSVNASSSSARAAAGSVRALCQASRTSRSNRHASTASSGTRSA